MPGGPTAVWKSLMGEETLGLRSLGAEAVLGDSAMSVWPEGQGCVCERELVLEKQKEKERRRERAREIGGWSLTSKQSVGLRGPLLLFLLRSPVPNATTPQAGTTALLYQWKLHVPSSSPCHPCRASGLCGYRSNGGVGWGSGSERHTATARLHSIDLGY